MELNLEKQPFVMVLIGPPLSGKDTFIRNNLTQYNPIIISRDDIVMSLSKTKDYNKAFDEVNQGAVNRQLEQDMINAGKSDRNVIINMTNMTTKRRKGSLSHFNSNFYKIAVMFPILTDEEFTKRNEIRAREENKYIGMHIIKQMINSYTPIDKSEGFDRVITIEATDI